MALVKKCRHARKDWRRCACSWYWDGYLEGRRQYVPLGADRVEARRKAARIEADRLEGKVARVIPRDATVAGTAERWLDRLEDLNRRPQTLRAYRTSANAVIDYFGEGRDVRLIDGSEVERFRSDVYASRRGAGPAALMQALRGILQQAHRDGLIPVVPQAPAERRTIAPNPNVRMTEAETAATLAVLRPAHWRDLADLIVLTGLRISEALALRWDDVDLRRGAIHVRHSAEQRGAVDAPTKTVHSTRQMRLERAALDIIARQPRDDERVFPRRYAAANTAIRRAMERAGTYKRDRGWHSLRHLNTALRDRAGQSIRQAGAELGHGANFVMTASYGWAAEAAEPAELSRVRQHDPPSPTDDAAAAGSARPPAQDAPAARRRARRPPRPA